MADKIAMIAKSEKPKLLDIGHERTCRCPPNHINCLTGKQWAISQVAIWGFSYEKRDIRDKKIHPAVFPIGLPSQCIKLFTHEGELVLDPFAGSGSTLIAAKQEGFNYIGFELEPEYCKIAYARIKNT